ncbi:L-ascorbate metabolism protein UlaG, beta-lactamase superfamily [Gemmobacter megaterium]|uniref:L-ascorbate metabolism protein UlaG, beta-lactamase superfamily n=1 Tax=Gemmobacter megaterium TaxID=1086013 RepID=A0A1N7KLX1_9RHOB|nr:Zn-dependent hydrolase [Gemmobacter megaterium]SIS62466.1 L-ascorbate metabolism protein UlaG, beta-lactamase superfamily [Gemmobacter megaterium]
MFHRLIPHAVVALVLGALPLAAQERIPSHCIGLAEAPGLEVVYKAGFGDPLGPNRVRISFLYHAMFLIETPGGLSAVTDYTGHIGGGDHVPTVVTMNNSHSTHWTPNPDPRIPHVLEGWGTADFPTEHDVELGEMRVRNVHTDARGGWEGGIRRNGNSIFVFEAAGLCIGHLGHLHHEPDAAQYAAIGRLDVVMVPVDGGYTMNVATMMKVISRLRSSVVLPMHWFSGRSLDIFLEGMKDEFDIVELDQNSIELGLHDLPRRPTIIVLAPELLRGTTAPPRRPTQP